MRASPSLSCAEILLGPESVGVTCPFTIELLTASKYVGGVSQFVLVVAKLCASEADPEVTVTVPV